MQKKQEANASQFILVIAGYFAGTSGYNVHTTSMSNALVQLGVNLLQLELQQSAAQIALDLNAIEKLCNEHPTKARINLYISPPDQIAPFLSCKGLSIVFVVWESTRLPPNWIPTLNAVDQVWYPSQWGADVIASHGVEQEKIKVVPEGVDVGLFNQQVQPMPALVNYSGFKFCHVGKYENRKGTEQLIRAFDETFDTENVYLILLSHNSFIENFNLSATVDALQLRRRDRVLCVSPLPTQGLIAALFRACDVGVFPTKAEGWGLPIGDAMACGLPCIVTNYSGVTEYANADCNWLLDYELIAITEPLFNPSTADNGASTPDFGQWAEPNHQQLCAHMKQAFVQSSLDDKPAYSALGRRALKRMSENFTWANAAQKGLAALADLIEADN